MCVWVCVRAYKLVFLCVCARVCERACVCVWVGGCVRACMRVCVEQLFVYVDRLRDSASHPRE